MARANFMQNSFLSGEWSPFAQGRTNQQEYYAALNLSLNAVSMDNGAWARRSGTRFSSHARTHDGNIKLVKFISETGDALVVELTALFARFHRAGRLLTDTGAPNVIGISSATPAVVTTDVAHGWSTNDYVVFPTISVVEAAPLFNRIFRITVLSSTTFSIAHTTPLSGSVDGSTLAGATVTPITVARITERALPYAGSEVSAVKYTEEEDTLYLFHPGHEINTVDRVLLPVTEQELLDGPYLDQNKTATTLGFSGVSGSGVTVTASSTTGINGNTGFQTTDVGRAIRVNSGTEAAPSWSWLEITARASPTSVTATVRGDNLASASATTLWRLGLYSNTTGWPVHGAVHEGRLWLIGASGRIDGSKTFDFFNFEPTAADGTVADDNGVSAIFAGSGRQKPRWLQSIDVGLLVGTDGGEYLVFASSFDDPVTPFTVQVRRKTAYGVADVLPEIAGNNTIFAQSLGRSIYEYGSRGGGRMDGADIARDARHLTSNGVVELAYVSEPVPIIYARRADNRLISATYRNDDDGRTIAWARHSLQFDNDVALGEDAVTGTKIPYLRGGQSSTSGSLYSIVSAPFSDFEQSRNDILWVAILRGSTVCVEYMTPVFDETFLDNEAFFVDSGNIFRQEDFGVTWERTVENPPTYVFYGLDRLNGKTVDVAFRGVDIGTAVVSGGALTMVIPEELTGTSAAYETTTLADYFDTGTLSFSSGFISNIEEAVIVRQKGFTPAEAFAVGADGNLYYTARDLAASPAGIYIVDAADGSLQDSVSETTIRSDLTADGAVPPGGWANPPPRSGTFAWTIPGTKYVISPLENNLGTAVNHGMVYYEINGAGSLVYTGAITEDPTGTLWQLVPGDGYVDDPPETKGLGLFCGSSNSDVLNGSTILMATFAENKSIIIPWPSPNYIAANTPVNITAATNIEGRSMNITSLFPTFSGIFGNSDGSEVTVRTSQAFFLPGPGSITYMFSYVNKEIMVQHAASTASRTVSALTTQSTISTDPVMVTGVITGTAYDNLRLLSMDFSGGARFEGFPFVDIGENFSGGAGSSGRNDYGNPSVFPSDVTDPKKPWFVFFPRLYPDSPDNVDKLGIRAFVWEPTGGFDGRGKATLMSIAKGKLYDVVTDSLPATQGFGMAVSIFWDRRDNTLYVLSTADNSANSDTVVSVFGSFDPITGTITTVDAGHIDAVIGCNYRSRFQLLRPDAGAGSQTGSGLGKFRRIDRFSVLAYRTGTFSIGADNFDSLKFAVMSKVDSLGRRPLFSGVFEDTLQADSNFDNMIIAEFSRPTPAAVAAISGFTTTQDK